MLHGLPVLQPLFDKVALVLDVAKSVLLDLDVRGLRRLVRFLFGVRDGLEERSAGRSEASSLDQPTHLVLLLPLDILLV